MVGSPASLATAFAGPSDADDYIQSVAEESLKVERVNDVIWEFDASRDYDPSAGLGLIQAPLLAVNFADDELNPVELGGLERAITFTAAVGNEEFFLTLGAPGVGPAGPRAPLPVAEINARLTLAASCVRVIEPACANVHN